jgi:signal transduction histidine kinase
MQSIEQQLRATADHLASRRSAILQAWRSAVDADPELTTASSLPRSQFYDHIPQLLDVFERKLRTWRRPDAATDDEVKDDAAGHGMQRWQQGYHLREVTREWGHLEHSLLDEVEGAPLASSPEAANAMGIARRVLVEFCNEGVSASTVQYFHLQQTEAAGHVRDLAETLREVQQLEQRRAEMLRQAAHDLRGSLGVVRNVTSGLTLNALPDAMREEFLGLLKRSVSSQQTMLDDLMNLARLQAGQELRDVKPFDAAVLLADLCDSLQFIAAERGLFLKREGPASLPVEGDTTKTRRIAQNLLLNALKYTTDGGVTVSWGDSRDNDRERWMLCVRDTGPGFHAGPGAPLAAALREATKDSRELDAKTGVHDPARAAIGGPIDAPDPRPVRQERGEGVGLSIVKRLCELLDASIELESSPDDGTMFRVAFPRHYKPFRDEDRRASTTPAT